MSTPSSKQKHRSPYKGTVLGWSDNTLTDKAVSANYYCEYCELLKTSRNSPPARAKTAWSVCNSDFVLRALLMNITVNDSHGFHT